MNISIFQRSALRPIYRYAMGNRDSELEQAGIRVLIGAALLFYFIKTGFHLQQPVANFHLDLIYILAAFLAVAISVAVWVFIAPGDNPLRLTIAIFLDSGTLTYLFLIGGNHTAPLYFLYQWIIIGYGFRFGKRYLFISLALSLAGFGAVILYVPYWRDDPGLSAGLWVGTLFISLYFSTLVGRLYKALDHAEEANRAKRQFICSVSHELRTPLNAIIGLIDLMRSTPVDRDQMDMLDCMTTTSQVMLSQIEDVLDFSKIEAGKMSVEHIDFDLYKLVQSILDIFRYRIDPFQIQLSHSIGSDVPYHLCGDPHHLRQILVNLLGNAVKFTEQGKITLRINKAAESGDQVRLRFYVRDTGIGIPDAAKDKIFESFTQADESTARRFGGTGLGTTICKQLVELMDGQIGFSSEQGKGSEFWFELNFIQDRFGQKLTSNLNLASIRSVIYSPAHDPADLARELNKICSVKSVVSKQSDHVVKLLEESSLLGMPVRLVFIDEPKTEKQSFNEYLELIRSRIRQFEKCSRHEKFTAILVTDDCELNHAITDVMDTAGLYSVLSLPVQHNSLMNILYGHAINLEKNSPHSLLNNPTKDTSASVPAKVSSVDDTGFEILVAEDNPTNRKVLQKILERAGHRCTLARDGDEALDVIDKKSFDAIVLDMNMPVMAGTDVARLCRLMQGSFSDLPIIMFSANVTPEARQESLEAGANEFLAKPIQVDIFLRTLDKLVMKFRLIDKPSIRTKKANESHGPMITCSNEPILNIQSLEDLENVSREWKFLDDLIVEFISENGKLLTSLEYVMAERDQKKFKEIIHTIKGSALSVGAVSLKMICRRLEKLSQLEIDTYPREILHQLRGAFSLLCEELEKYRSKRYHGLNEN